MKCIGKQAKIKIQKKLNSTFGVAKLEKIRNPKPQQIRIF